MRMVDSVFSPSGEKLRSFGTYGSGEGQFKNPFGVAVDGERNILVADCLHSEFTAEGQFLAAVGTKGSGSIFPLTLHSTLATTRCMWWTMGIIVFKS